ncbi:MAG: hypothetical protein CMJ58_01195 [Planctomycetaceae bacterium]|nr:hypothetical protein [Planctomycetaceae bacterium]
MRVHGRRVTQAARVEPRRQVACVQRIFVAGNESTAQLHGGYREPTMAPLDGPVAIPSVRALDAHHAQVGNRLRVLLDQHANADPADSDCAAGRLRPGRTVRHDRHDDRGNAQGVAPGFATFVACNEVMVVGRNDQWLEQRSKPVAGDALFRQKLASAQPTGTQHRVGVTVAREHHHRRRAARLNQLAQRLVVLRIVERVGRQHGIDVAIRQKLDRRRDGLDMEDLRVDRQAAAQRQLHLHRLDDVGFHVQQTPGLHAAAGHRQSARANCIRYGRM